MAPSGLEPYAGVYVVLIPFAMHTLMYVISRQPTRQPRFLTFAQKTKSTVTDEPVFVAGYVLPVHLVVNLLGSRSDPAGRENRDLLDSSRSTRLALHPHLLC